MKQINLPWLKYWPPAAFILIFTLLSGFLFKQQGPFNGWMMRMHQKEALESPVRIVYFDRQDIESMGGWPLSRNVYGFLIRRLFELGVRQAGVHVYWGSNPTHDENDIFLKSSLDQHDGIVGSFYFHQLGAWSEREKTVESLSWYNPNQKVSKSASGLQPPDEYFHTRGIRFGFVNLPLTSSGIVIEAPLLVRCGEALYPSFNWLLALGYDQNMKLPGSARIRINYRVSQKHLPMISVRDLLSAGDNEEIREQLKDAVVIIGVVSSQLGFERPTPLDPAMPVIGIHAQAVDNLLTGSWLKEFPLAVTFLFILLIAGVTFVYPFLTVQKKWLAFGVLFLGSAG